MPELATAWITLAISADNMQRDIRRELNKIDDGTAKTVGRKMGRDLEQSVGQGAQGAANEVRARLSERLGAEVGQVVGRGVGGALKGSMTAAAKVGELALKGALVGAAGAATLAVGGVGLALTKGFDRLKSIDEAKFKLKALGNDAGSIAKIMDSALASVKGTAFGMDDAVTAASSAVAAGIKPGQDLTKYLSEVGDAAAVAGTNFTDMGSIFNKIQTSNKAYTDDLQQLSDRGLPIFTWLQKEYGVTADQLTKMVQSGEVDAAHFQHAIETNIGGAAKTMGQSFSGSVDNAMAAVGRLGAAFLAPIFGNAAGGISGLTDGLDSLTSWVNAHQPEIIKFFAAVGEAAITFGQNLLQAFGQALHAAGQFSTALGSALDFFGVDNNLSSVGDQLNHIGDSLINTASGWDSAKDKVSQWGIAMSQAAQNAQGAYGPITGVGTALGALPFKKVIGVDVDTKGAKDKVVGIGNAVAALKDKTVTINVKGNLAVSGQSSADNGAKPSFFGGDYSSFGIDPFDEVKANPTLFGPAQAPPNPIRMVPRGGGRATGGGISGPGGPTSDMIPAMLSNGEHVWTAAEVNKVGGQGAMYALRSMVRGFSTGGASSNTGGALTPNAAQLQSLIQQVFPQITNIGGWRPPDGFNEHSSGQALDLMIPNANTPEGKALGDQVNQWLLQNAGALGIDYDLWQQTQWNPNGTTSAMSDRGGTTANHKDHVHVRVKPGEATGATLAQSFSDSMGEGAQKEADKQLASSKGGSKSSSNDATSLGQSLFSGLLQGIGLDGSVFSDFTQWPNFKSGMALANFGGSLLKGVLGGSDDTSADSGGVGGGALSSIGLNSLTGLIKPSGMGATTPYQNLPDSPHAGTGAAPGPALVVNGNVGMDPRALTQRADAAQNQAWRKSGMNAVRPG